MELKDYLPKRGEDSSGDSSESEDQEPAVRRGMNLKERLDDLVSSEGKKKRALRPRAPCAELLEHGNEGLFKLKMTLKGSSRALWFDQGTQS